MKKKLDGKEVETSPLLSEKKVTLLECFQDSSSASAVEWSSGEGFDLTIGENNPIQIDWGNFKVMKILVDRINADLYSIAETNE